MKRKLAREGKRKQFVLFGLARIKEFSMPQVDMEEGYWNTLVVTLTEVLTSTRGDPVNKRRWSGPLGRWVSRGQIRAFHLFQEKVTRFSRKMPVSSMASEASLCQPREDFKGTETLILALYFCILELK